MFRPSPRVQRITRLNHLRLSRAAGRWLHRLSTSSQTGINHLIGEGARHWALPDSGYYPAATGRAGHRTACQLGLRLGLTSRVKESAHPTGCFICACRSLHFRPERRRVEGKQHTPLCSIWLASPVRSAPGRAYLRHNRHGAKHPLPTSVRAGSRSSSRRSPRQSGRYRRLPSARSTLLSGMRKNFKHHDA